MNIITTDYALETMSYDIFFSGCRMGKHCEGCHNSEAWSFDVGTEWTLHKEKIEQDISDFSTIIRRIFILGGEPLDQEQSEFMQFISWAGRLGKELWLFTRYDISEVPEAIKEKVTYIKCGAYKPELTVNNNIHYGVKLATSNQYIVKVDKDNK